MTASHFYVPVIDTASGKVTVSGSEFRHLARAARVKVGEEVTVFDGTGRRSRAVVGKITPAMAELSLVGEGECEKAGPGVRLAQAGLPAGKMEFVLQKAAELGAAEFIPLRTSRSFAPSAERAARRSDRWVAIVKEAVKQCKGSSMTAVGAWRGLPDFLAEEAGGPRLYLAEHGGRPLRDVALELAAGTVSVAVGPEGGWSPEEEKAFEGAGFLPVWLGARILRAETAALVALFVLDHFRRA